MDEAQRDLARQVRGGVAPLVAANKLVVKRALALSMAAALVAAPAVAFADQQAQPAAAQAQEQQAAPEQANTDAGDNKAPVAENGVAKVGDKAYSKVQDAVDAAKDGDTVKLVKNTNENVTVNNKKLIFQREGEVTFSGTLRFEKKGSAGSRVDNLAFENDGTHDSVVVYGVVASTEDPVVIQGSTFSTPSRADKVSAQPSAVNVSFSKGVEVKNNTFNLGRISGASNVAVNAIGNGVGDLTISGNTLNVGVAAQGLANEDGTVDLLIAMGNNGGTGAGGVKRVTVTGNTFDGSQDNGDGTNNRFAGLSEVKDITFESNTVKNAARGIAQSGYRNRTFPSAQVHIGQNNTFTNVASPFEAMTVQDPERNDNIGATVLKDDGELVGYNWIQDAVKAVNNGGHEFDGATIAIQKSVDTHPSYTLNKKVTFTAPKIRDYTFNGSLRLNESGTKVTGMHFVLDGGDLKFKDGKYKSGVRQSVILSNGADGIEVSGNTFDLPSLDKGFVEFQLSSVWLESGVSGSKITGNEFNLGRAYNNTNVGINFVGAANTVIENTTVSDNKVTFTADRYSAENANSLSGNAYFVIANGNRKGENDADYGIDVVTATGNVIDGTAVPDMDYGVGISNVKNATFTGNTITGTSEAVRYSKYNGVSRPSTGLTFKGNTLTDNYANVDFKPFFEAGTMTPADITYGEGNTVEVSKYASRDPVVSGMAFAGWYSDADFQTVAKDGDTNVYGKLVPISDVVKFMGGSLNMGAYKKADGTTDYTKTDLRFGFNVVAPNSERKLDSWKWATTYTKADGSAKTLETEGKNFRKPYAAEVGKGYSDGIVTNLLLTGVGSSYYGTDFTTRLSVTYTTPDGTQATVADSPQTRSVKGVADAIKGSTTASDAEQAYADGILGETKNK